MHAGDYTKLRSSGLGSFLVFHVHTNGTCMGTFNRSHRSNMQLPKQSIVVLQ